MELAFSDNKKPPLLTVFLLSMLSLSYEVLLTRFLSIIQWHHFAYMIISIALLGYGASGAFITMFQRTLRMWFPAAFFINIILFAVSSIAGLLVLQQLQFNPLEMFWNKSQWIWLLILYALLILPFFFAANCTGLVLFHYHKFISESYAADLLGAAMGALGIIILLHWFFPITTLQYIASSAGFASLIAVLELNLRKRLFSIGLIIAVLPWLLPNSWLEIKPSEFKSLSQTLHVVGARIINEKASPLGVLTVVKSPVIPFRHAPGLALTSPGLPPKQLGVFSDGENMSAITHFNDDILSLNYLNYMSTALPYHLLHKPKVLILGAGGGTEVLQAKYFRAERIDAVELNPQIVELVRDEYAEFAGNIYNAENINIHIMEARAYLQQTDEKYDLIQMALMDSFATSAAGLHALNESYLYTVEAMKLYLNHLKPNGLLSLTRWVKLPPRDTLKLVSTAKQALLQSGTKKTAQHIALIRSWNTATLIIKNNPLNQNDIETIKKFSQTRSFDVAYYPGIKANEINQYNILPEAYFYEGTKALLSEYNQRFINQYKYNLQPATDDQPYFFNFLKWRTLPEIFLLPANQGLALIEWGNIILLATLVQAFIASLIIIILPLWIYSKRHNFIHQSKNNIFVFSYFTLLGIAFMFVEIAFIQRFILFLGHPTYAVAVVLAGFLIFAGCGSAFSKKLTVSQALKIATMGIGLLALLYLLVLPAIFTLSIDHNDPIKIIISLILIAPLAFFMGMPFPQGLAFLAHYSPKHIPWAWGVNGCASVISAISATLVAMHFGFTVVILVAVLCYILAGTILIRKTRTQIAEDTT